MLRRTTILSDLMLFCWHEKLILHSISPNKTPIQDSNWVSHLWQVWYQLLVRKWGRLPVSLPQYDVHRFQTGRDVGFGDFRSVRFQHVGLCGFHVRHRGCQPLPQAQEIVNTIWGKLPVLRKTKRAGHMFLIFAHNILTSLMPLDTKNKDLKKKKMINFYGLYSLYGN